MTRVALLNPLLISQTIKKKKKVSLWADGHTVGALVQTVLRRTDGKPADSHVSYRKPSIHSAIATP